MELLTFNPSRPDFTDCEPQIAMRDSESFDTLLNQKLQKGQDEQNGGDENPFEEPELESVEHCVQPQEHARAAAAAECEVVTSQTDHEVVENLMSQMVEDGQLTMDEEGRRVMLMRLCVPGRGDVRVRMWHKPEGLDLKLKATDASTETLLRTNADQLRQGLANRGVRLSKLEV